jgi:RimJ/RimL family protein N-acetyltransferase
MQLNIREGFHLSSLKTSDAEKYLEHFADGEISQYIPHIPYPYKKNIADWWISHRNEITRREGKELFFAIRNPEGVLIGTIGVNDFPFGSFHRAESNFGWQRRIAVRGL